VNAYEWSSSIISAIAATINLGALVFVGMQVRNAASESRRAAEYQEAEGQRQRKRDTINAVIATSQQRDKLKTALPWNDRDAVEVADFLRQVEQDQDRRAAVRAFLDYLEMIAAGVNDGVFDVETVSRTFGGRIVAVASNYAPYIELRRRELNSPSLYIELESVAASIREYRQNLPSLRTDHVPSSYITDVPSTGSSAG
jgi:hypothetical protein